MATATLNEQPPPQVTMNARRELCDRLIGAIGDPLRFGGPAAAQELDGIVKRALLALQGEGWFLTMASDQVLNSKTLIWSLYVPDLLALSKQRHNGWARIQHIAYEVLFLHHLANIYPFVVEQSALSICRFRVVYDAPEEIAAARKSIGLIVTQALVSRLVDACRRGAGVGDAADHALGHKPAGTDAPPKEAAPKA